MRGKKYLLTLLVLILMLSACAFGAYASNPIRIFVNGNEVASDVAPQIIDGRTMVPIRFVGEALGADVNWDSQNNSVLIQQFANSSVDKDRLFLYSEVRNYIDLWQGIADNYVTLLESVGDYYYETSPGKRAILENYIPQYSKAIKDGYALSQVYEDENINGKLAAYGYDTSSIESVKQKIEIDHIVIYDIYNDIENYGPSVYDSSKFNNAYEMLYKDNGYYKQVLLESRNYFNREYISYIQSL